MDKGMTAEEEKSGTDIRAEKGLVEGIDFYFENGLMVLTAKFLRDRGNCCSNGCRNCPYPEDDRHDSASGSPVS
ncbi:MAG TPA: DUF5522 domain-containing protein [Aridibacter sp.]|nr:DUF5522 domain-containing protein [Aridibacter sp.]